MKLLLYALLIFTISCSNNNRAKEIKQIMSQNIKLPKNHLVSILGRDTIMDEYPLSNLKLVAYRDSSGCSYCDAKHLTEWDPFIIDINNEFEQLNPHLPKNKAMHTFLLDENNNVVLVGNPLHNPKIEKMFKEIVEEKLGEK